MVNLATVPALAEPISWPATLPELQDGWWPTGGPVDAANDLGIMNWQASLLGSRTQYLRGAIEGAGVGVTDAPTIADFNAVTKSGLYRGTGAANAPGAGTYVVLHKQGAAAGQAVQIASAVSGPAMWVRRANASVWSAWSSIWHGEAAPFAFGVPGYQKLPSGLIMQWLTTSISIGTTLVTASLPVTFPNGALMQGCTRSSATGPVSDDIYSVNCTTTQVTIRRVAAPAAVNSQFVFVLGY